MPVKSWRITNSILKKKRYPVDRLVKSKVGTLLSMFKRS